jgi:hypothetical protein
MPNSNQDTVDALLAKSAWSTMPDALLTHMPAEYREAIGRKAIQGASYVSQLDTINASRHARGQKPLSMTMFAAGVGDDE